MPAPGDGLVGRIQKIQGFSAERFGHAALQQAGAHTSLSHRRPRGTVADVSYSTRGPGLKATGQRAAGFVAGTLEVVVECLTTVIQTLNLENTLYELADRRDGLRKPLQSTVTDADQTD